MTNISNAEKIKNAFVSLFNVKFQNDTQKAEEYTTKYLEDGAIDENEFQEISMEFGEDFAEQLKGIAGAAPKDIEEIEGGNINDYAKAIALANDIESALNQPDCKENWNTVIKLLENASPEEIQVANLYFQMAYKDQYEGRDMIQEIAANYPDGGTNEAIKGQRDALKLAMQGKTNVTDQDSLDRAQKAISTFAKNGMEPVEHNQSDPNAPSFTDAEALEVACELEKALAIEGGQEDWEKVNEILDGLSDKQMQQVNIAYKLAYGDKHEGRDLIQEICANEIDEGKTSEQDLKYKAIMSAMRGQTDLTDAESIAYEQQTRNNSTSEETSNGSSGGTKTGELTMYDYAVANEGNTYNSRTLVKDNYLAWANSVDENRVGDSVTFKDKNPGAEESKGSKGSEGSSDAGKVDHALKVDKCQWAFEQAEGVHDAIDGNDDWSKLKEILCGLGNEDLNLIMMAYKEKYDKDMKKEIEKQTVGTCGFDWGTDWNETKDEVVSALTKAQGSPNKNGEKEKEDIKKYEDGERW